MPDFSFETQAIERLTASGVTAPIVCGVDEAGRGPWAGPVTTAAAVLDPTRLPTDLLDALDDSKKLSAKKREALFKQLMAAEGAGVAISVAQADVAEIDEFNILGATLRAMARAVAGLALLPHYALIDGNRMPKLPCAGETVVKGDGRSLSIAAASIIAKVTRDHLMQDIAAQHPGYGWERNAGYGTKEHQIALEKLGVTPHHRRSFAPVARRLTRLI